MPDKYRLSWDPKTRTARYLHVDQVNMQAVVQTVQDTDPVYEYNKKVRNSGMNLKLPDWGQKVGEIPIQDLVKLKKEYPDLMCKDADLRERTLRKILTTHPDRFKWLQRDKF